MKANEMATGLSVILLVASLGCGGPAEKVEDQAARVSQEPVIEVESNPDRKVAELETDRPHVSVAMNVTGTLTSQASPFGSSGDGGNSWYVSVSSHEPSNMALPRARSHV